jgi:hypothetical protein
MMTKQATIEDIAAQLDRLCPSQVDETESGNGQQEAGHNAHDSDGVLSIGWYCSGGNCGHPVCSIPVEQVQPLYDYLDSLPDGSLDDGGIDKIVVQFGGEWLA